jgi:heat shock protein HslJ
MNIIWKKRLTKPALTVMALILLMVPLMACTRTQNDSLEDTAWILTSILDSNEVTPVLPDKNLTLTFNKTQGYYGSDANNGNYGGAYTVNRNIITFGTTTHAGFTVPDEPPGFLRQYQSYFAYLQQAHTYKITDNQLTIYCGDNKYLNFSRMGNSTK